MGTGASFREKLFVPRTRAEPITHDPQCLGDKRVKRGATSTEPRVQSFQRLAAAVRRKRREKQVRGRKTRPVFSPSSCAFSNSWSASVRLSRCNLSRRRTIHLAGPLSAVNLSLFVLSPPDICVCLRLAFSQRKVAVAPLTGCEMIVSPFVCRQWSCLIL